MAAILREETSSEQNRTVSRRLERKLVVEAGDPERIAGEILTHPALFREIFTQRQVNNVYWDTEEESHFEAHERGALSRCKVRWRWYGRDAVMIESAVLEIKHKTGFLGWKERIPVEWEGPVCDLYGRPMTFGLGKMFSDLWHLRGEEYRPVLGNRYQRRYFLSADRRVRVTLDWDLCFFSVNQTAAMLRLDSIRQSPQVIIEVKYDQADEDEAETVIHRFPFRMSRFSKYMTGRRLLKALHGW